jgi:hypothetical protein
MTKNYIAAAAQNDGNDKDYDGGGGRGRRWGEVVGAARIGISGAPRGENYSTTSHFHRTMTHLLLS